MRQVRVEQIKDGERKLVWQGSGEDVKVRLKFLSLRGGQVGSGRWLRLMNSAGEMIL